MRNGILSQMAESVKERQMSVVLSSLRMDYVCRVELRDDAHQVMHDLSVDMERLIHAPLQNRYS